MITEEKRTKIERFPPKLDLDENKKEDILQVLLSYLFNEGG